MISKYNDFILVLLHTYKKLNFAIAITFYGYSFRKCFYVLNIIRSWQQFCEILFHFRGEKTCLDKSKNWLRWELDLSVPETDRNPSIT